jgi:hypothetical protein
MNRRALLVLSLAAFAGLHGGCLCSDIPDLSAHFDSGANAVDASNQDGGPSDAGPADAGPADSGAPDAGLVCVPDAGSLPPVLAYWALNEGAGNAVQDLTGNGNVGLFSDGGDRPIWGQGEYCGGLTFTGDGGLVDFGQGNNNAFKITGSLTVSAWFNYGFISQVGDMPIVSKRGSPRGWELYVEGQDGTVVFDVAYDGGGAYVAAGAWTPAAGVWHHAVGVYDAQQRRVRVYLDGDAGDDLDFDAGEQFDNGESVHLGAGAICTSGPCTRTFNGAIDEVRIWNVALPAAQVQQIP